MKSIEVIPSYCDSHQHHIEERAVFVGCGVRAGNEVEELVS